MIARNSSFAFKGQAIDVTEIGKKLGVQFIVEGSVRLPKIHRPLLKSFPFFVLALFWAG